MPFIRFSYWILAYAIGITCISIQIAGVYKKIESKERLSFHITFLLLIIFMTLSEFSTYVSNVPLALDYLILFSCLLIALTLPLNINVRKRIAFTFTDFSNTTTVFISVILFIVLVLSIIFPFYNIAGFLIIIFLITAVIFAIVFDSINHLKPEFIKKKKIYSIGSKIALIFLPFLLFIDIFRDAIPVIKNKIPGGYYSVPFFFIFLSVFTILEIHEYYKFLKERHLSEKVNSCILKKYSLSDKEIEVLKLLMDGYSYIEIGIFLYISTERVKTHISRIYRKTETTNKIELFKLVTSN